MAQLARQRHYDVRGDWWDKFWKGPDGKIVVFQWPNALLIAWLVLTIGSLVAPTGKVEAIFWWLSIAALAAWAVLEIWKGVNYFRKALGVVVLLFTVMAALKLL